MSATRKIIIEMSMYNNINPRKFITVEHRRSGLT